MKYFWFIWGLFLINFSSYCENVPAHTSIELEKEILQEQKKISHITHHNKELQTKIDGYRQEIMHVSELIQNHEKQMNTIEQTLTELTEKEKKNSIIQSVHHKSLGRVFISLHHISRSSPILMAITSRNPHEIVQCTLVLRSAIPYFKTIANKLRLEIEDLKALRQSIIDEKMMLSQTAIRLTSKQEDLSKLLKEKSELQQKNEAHLKKIETHVQHLAQEAKNIRQLIAELEAEGAVGVYKKLKRVRDAKSIIPKSNIPNNRYNHFQMVTPVMGKISAKFGQKTEKNDQGLGTLFVTRPHAQVVSPATGQVVFAGPFRSYNKIIIIDHSRGFHTLFAGMNQILVKVGQEVVSGEPIGIMVKESPKLYMELRRDGEPVNPQKWLTKAELN